MRRLHGTNIWAGLAAVIVLTGATGVRAASNETSNGCAGTSDDPCTRSGSCEIQGAAWSQDVTIDRADRFDTMGWPGLCDMVHVGLVQGNCQPPGAQLNVTVDLSETSFAVVPEIVGPLACAGDPPPAPVPAMSAAWRGALGCLLILACIPGRRSRGALRIAR